MSKSRPRKIKENTEAVTAILNLCYELLIWRNRHPMIGNTYVHMQAKHLFETIDKLVLHTIEEKKGSLTPEELEKEKEKQTAALINIKTNAGYSPTYYAVKFGHFNTFKKLVAKGANLDTLYDGLTLRDIVKQELVKQLENRNYQEIEKMLSSNKIEYNEKLLDQFKNQITHKQSSQAWIKDPLKEKGYKEATGFCFGVSYMGAQAFLLTERDKDNNLVNLSNFTQRLTHLSKAKNIVQEVEISRQKRIILVNRAKILLYSDKPEGFKLPANQEQIAIEKIISDSNYCINLAKSLIYKDKPKGSLSAEEEKIAIDNIIGHDYNFDDEDKINLDMDPFLNGVELYQQIYKHSELTSNKENKQSCLPGMNLVPNIALEKEGGAVIIDQLSSNQYDKQELKALFSKIQEVATKAKNENYDTPVVLVLNANKHTITIGYDPIKDEWRNIDANHPTRSVKSYSSSSIADVVEQELATIFGEKDFGNLKIDILSTAAKADATKKNIITPLHQSPEWKGKPEESRPSFFVKYKKEIRYAVGCTLAGGAFIAASFFTAGMLPLAITLAMAVVGPLVIGAGWIPALKQATTFTPPKEPNLVEEHLKTSVEKYKKAQKKEQKNKKKQKQEKIHLPQPSTTKIVKNMDIQLSHPNKEEKSSLVTENPTKTTEKEKGYAPATELAQTKEKKKSPTSTTKIAKTEEKEPIVFSQRFR